MSVAFLQALSAQIFLNASSFSKTFCESCPETLAEAYAQSA
jgi:hypothetical protein